MIQIGTTRVSSDSLRSTFDARYLQAHTESAVTLFAAHRGTTPTLRHLRRQVGPTLPREILEVWLFTIDAYLGKGTLTPYQIREVATLILSEFAQLNLSELAIFVRLFKAGQFQSCYGRIDPHAILTSLHEFVKLRAAAIDHGEREEARQRRAATDAHRADCITAAQFLALKGYPTMEAYRQSIADELHPLRPRTAPPPPENCTTSARELHHLHPDTPPKQAR